MVLDGLVETVDIPRQDRQRLEIDIGHDLAHPAFVYGGHLRESAPALLRQTRNGDAPVVAGRFADDETVGFESFDQTGDVAIGHHGPLGDLSETQAVRLAVELGDKAITEHEDFNSQNTHQLTVAEMVATLERLDYIKSVRAAADGAVPEGI